MPNWSDDEGGCDCPLGHENGLGPGRHRAGEPGCVSGPPMYKPRSIDALIDASSLGTPGAKALRKGVPKEVVDRILKRADEIAAECEEEGINVADLEALSLELDAEIEATEAEAELEDLELRRLAAIMYLENEDVPTALAILKKERDP